MRDSGSSRPHEQRNAHDALVADDGNFAESPSAVTYSRETMHDVGKYT